MWWFLWARFDLHRALRCVIINLETRLYTWKDYKLGNMIINLDTMNLGTLLLSGESIFTKLIFMFPVKMKFPTKYWYFQVDVSSLYLEVSLLIRLTLEWPLYLGALQCGSCSTIICAIMKKGDRRYQSQKIAQHIKNKTHQKHHEENLRIGGLPNVWS